MVDDTYFYRGNEHKTIYYGSINMTVSQQKTYALNTIWFIDFATISTERNTSRNEMVENSKGQTSYSGLLMTASCGIFTLNAFVRQSRPVSVWITAPIFQINCEMLSFLKTKISTLTSLDWSLCIYC